MSPTLSLYIKHLFRNDWPDGSTRGQSPIRPQSAEWKLFCNFFFFTTVRAAEISQTWRWQHTESLYVYMHSPVKLRLVITRLGHLIGLLSLSRYTGADGELIYSPTLLQWVGIWPIQLVATGPFPLDQISYKQVSKKLAESTLNGKNMDNFTALYTLYLRFTFATN